MDLIPDADAVTFGDALAFVRDLLSVGLAALGSWLAWLSIKLGREQDAVTEKQVRILEKLEALEFKQAEIAESQHAIAKAQLARKARLELRCPSKGVGTHDDGRTKHYFALEIANAGDKPAREVHWRVLVPCISRHLDLSAESGNVVISLGEAHEPVDVDGETWVAVYLQLVGRYDGPIYAGQSVPCAQLVEYRPSGKSDHRPVKECEYVIESEDGRFPAEGVGTLSLELSWNLAALKVSDAPEVWLGDDYVLPSSEDGSTTHSTADAPEDPGN